jgi:pimeloyl-ACP methyl ester carboxylesterase
LLLCHRFRGTIDDWDPAFLNVLAAERDVIVFDGSGVGYSSGEAPGTVAGMADGVIEFLGALALDEVDVLGWSMGGFVAQSLALRRPEMVRRLIVAGSKPGLVPGAPAPDPEVGRVAAKPVNDAEDLLYLFFPPGEEGRAAGLASLERLAFAENPATVSPRAVQAQSAALTRWSRGTETAWDDLEELSMPILVAAGAQDRLMDAFHSYAMVRRLPNATLTIYGDAGHAFLFQHASGFAGEVVRFLAGGSA